MASKGMEGPLITQNNLETDSVDERGANETTPLLGSINDFGQSSDSLNARHDGPKPRSINDRVLYGSLFSVFLLASSLVFFIVGLNLRATLPPTSSPETIANLTRQVKDLSHSLSTCESNSTRIAVQLHNEQQRMTICRESEARLEERVAVVEGLLEVCQRDELDLKEQLHVTQNELGMCVGEKEELKKKIESGTFVQFLDMVGTLGTGGDSWVCTGKTLLWSHGYASDQSPHPTISIQTWTEELSNTQHSKSPLVFPPPPPSMAGDADSHPPSPSRPSRHYDSSISKLSRSQAQLSAQVPTSQSGSQTRVYDSSPRIIGFTILSLNSSGGNGWWRITKLPAFAIKGGTIEFFASADAWYKHTARFQVTVYWIEDRE